MGDFYESVVLKPTVERCDVRALASKLAQTDKVQAILEELVCEMVENVLANNGVSFERYEDESYDDDERVCDKLYEELDGPAVRDFVEKRGHLQPYYTVDDRDERNKAVVREHVARAKELVKGIKRIS